MIGVGKTTLVNRIARALGARTVFEEFETNPFLPSFYRDREAFAFSTQIFFLMSRFRQQEELAQGDLFQSHTLSDYFFDKDRIFAYLTLHDHELKLYERLFEVLKTQVVSPDLIVWLKAEHEVVMERIRRRGRSYELNMDPGYIRDLAHAYGFFFSKFDQIPVLTIDTTHVDLRKDEAAFDRLMHAIKSGDHALDLDPTRSRPTTLDLPFA